MAHLKYCAQCGSTLEIRAPEGLCPRCLVGMGLNLAGVATPPLPSDSQASPKPSFPASPKPRVFGEYELLNEIARGGMGIVYRARQRSLNRIVAVKVLLFGEFSSDDFVRRFRAEAEAAASLQHPNIVAIHEVGQHEDRHYFSMDFIEGENLDALVKRRPPGIRQAAACLKTIAEAIYYAHRQGILHRDLKPSNILIDANGDPHIT